VTHTIQIPYAPGAVLWCRASVTDKAYAPCPDCGGGKCVVILTNAGMYEVPCETCSAGWEGPRGWVTVKEWRWTPAAVVLGEPQIREGKVTYETRHGMFPPEELFEDEAVCAAHCAQRDEESRAAVEQQNWNRAKYGRSETARRLNWHRTQLKQAERDVAYHAARVKELTT